MQHYNLMTSPLLYKLDDVTLGLGLGLGVQNAALWLLGKVVHTWRDLLPFLKKWATTEPQEYIAMVKPLLKVSHKEKL